MKSWHAAQAAIADPRSPAASRTIPTASADSPAAPDEVRFLTTRSLSVILPAYNEEEVIQHTADVVTNVLRPWVPEFEVIVVND